MSAHRYRLWVAFASLALGACASLPTAEVEAPAELRQIAVLPLPAAHGRTGKFDLAGPYPVQGEFSRSAERLTLLEAVDMDRAALRLDLQGASSYRCTLRRTSAHVSVVALAVRPMLFRCSDGGLRQMQIDEQVRATRTERTGTFTDGKATLQIESIHRLRGSPLPLEKAGGYLLSHQGKPVAVVDLMDRTPRLRMATPAPELGPAIRDAALLLALHWDPAS